jgi:hypothetical protein
MSITKEHIEERKALLTNDIDSVKQRMADNDKKKQEDVALLNALTGAYQQCDMFLKGLDDEEPETVSDDGNDLDFVGDEV